MRALRLFLILGLVAACSSGDTTSPVLHQVAGTWKLIEHLEGPANSVVCDDTARVTISQASAALTIAGDGNVHCHWATGDSLVTPVSYAAAGRLDGHNVTLPDPTCPYAGTVNGTDDVMSGSVDCPGSALGVGGRVTGTWRLVRSDFAPPTMSLALSPAGATHGDTVLVTISAADNLALQRLGFAAVMDGLSPSDGTCPPPNVTVSDSVTLSLDTTLVAFKVAIPACTGRMDVMAFAADTAGNRQQASGTLFVRLPVSTVTGTLSDTLYTLGDSARITITATNPDGLGWLGVRWTTVAPIGAESVLVSGTSAQHTFAVRLPPGDPPFRLYVTVFARHTLGFRSSVDVPDVRTTDAQQLPVQSLRLSAVPLDWIWSPRRDRVYLAQRFVSTVHEVGLAPLATTATFTLPGYGASLDLTEGEDSLVVARGGALAVSVVPLGGGAVTDIPVTPPDLIDIYDTRRVRVVAGARAMIGVGSGSAGAIMELDLGTAAQRFRVPWGGYGTFERGARARMLMDDGGSPVGSQVYLAATDTFLPPASGLLHGYQPVADSAGTRWLVSSELFDAALTLLSTMSGEPLYQPCALAPDGTRVYCARMDGFTEYDAATGLKLRAIHLPVGPTRLLGVGAGRVLAIRDSTLYLVTLP